MEQFFMTTNPERKDKAWESAFIETDSLFDADLCLIFLTDFSIIELHF